MAIKTATAANVSSPTPAGYTMVTERWSSPMELTDDQDACPLRRPRQPDEHAAGQRLHRSLGGVRPAPAAAEGSAGHLRALVLRRHGDNRDAASADHPRFLRLPGRALRLRLSRARRSRTGTRDRRTGETALGRSRSRSMGARPRHLVG